MPVFLLHVIALFPFVMSDVRVVMVIMMVIGEGKRSEQTCAQSRDSKDVIDFFQTVSSKSAK
jgi:hypothetical protein